jgi:hypothetical protein
MRKNTEKTQNTWLRLLASGLRDQKKKKGSPQKPPVLILISKSPGLQARARKDAGGL